MISFEVLHQSKRSNARVGRLHTPHGSFLTPAFVGVGTNGTLKSIDNALAESLDLMFMNTYHLLLQPGPDLIQKMGGIHKFTGRKRPIITDSGGFQVFSLMYGSVASELKSQGTKKHSNSVLKITEEGVLFRSYRCGKKILLTPELSMEAQKKIGADLMIVFDELPPYHVDPKSLRRSFDRTHRWEKRSLDYHLSYPNNQGLYSVIHGGIDLDLRKESIDLLKDLPFDGHAFGGSLGKTREEMVHMLTQSIRHLPKEKPIHLLGIADLPSIDSCIPLGIDTFDSAYPTKAARHGTLLTQQGPLRILLSSNKDDSRPIEEGCSCHTCTYYSRAYLHHLFKAKELTGLYLASLHNLHFMIDYMKKMQKMILEDKI